MSTKPPVENTTVEQVEIDETSWSAAPGAEHMALPEDKKPNFFTSNDPDLSYLDEEPKEEEGSAQPTKSVLDEIDKEFLNPEEGEEGEEETEPKKSAGRPKTEKDGLVNFLKKRIDSGEMFAFDDYDEEKQNLDEYLGTLSEKDIEELWTANMDHIKQEVASQTPKEFFESLPEDLQYAAEYVMNGGTDLKGLFKALSDVQEVRDLSPDNEGDRKQIIRQYLQITDFGTEEEIEKEISEWEDLGVLESKAKQFKPKLDKRKEDMIQAQLAEQEAIKEQQRKASQAYMDNVFQALRGGELNGIKLDKKIQNQLYDGLVNPQYASITGRPTNLLGHLLEKYQYTEPNYGLISEALWLLSDPQGYRTTLIQQGKNQATEDTVKKLKTEQSGRKTSSQGSGYEQESKFKKLPKSNRNIFKS